MSRRRSLRVAAVVASAALLGITGCARFDSAQSQPFTTKPQMAPGATSTPPPPAPLPAQPFPKACPAQGVMQGCLESTHVHPQCPRSFTRVKVLYRVRPLKEGYLSCPQKYIEG